MQKLYQKYKYQKLSISNLTFVFWIHDAFHFNFVQSLLVCDKGFYRDAESGQCKKCWFGEYSMILLPASPVQRDKPCIPSHLQVPMNVLVRKLLFLTYSGEEIAS